MEPPIKIRRIGDRRLALSISKEWLQTEDVWLQVLYIGDRVAAFIGGELVVGRFYFGQPWVIGLRKFADRLADEEMIFVFHPVHPDVRYILDLPDAVQAELKERGKPLLRIEDPTAQIEYRTLLTFGQ